MTVQKYILWFEEVDKNDIAIVGGKGANLGEMVSFGVPVPPGFIVASTAYFYFLEENNLRSKIKEILAKVNKNEPEAFSEASGKIKKLILQSKMPKDLALEIMKAYLKLSGHFRQILVAVRSSATSEDLPEASFAGQQSTYLNVKGEANVVKKVQECWASLFEARAIFYREQYHFDHLKVGIAVPIQKMIQSEIAGVMFTLDPVTNQKNRILVEAIYGLGEFIVQGVVTPDRYLVDKNTLEILSKDIAVQPIQLIKVGSFNKKTTIIRRKQDQQKLTDKQIIEVAKLGKKIHQHYFFPQDVEWAIEKGKIFIVQTRPVTTTLTRKESEKKEKDIKSITTQPILSGLPASPGIATGVVRIIPSPKDINKIKKGEVLVTGMTTPDFVPAMKKAVAIITDRGGQTSHAAIVSRELGVPCIVGTEKGTKVLKNGQIVTINGKTGQVYKGGIPNLTSSLLPQKEEREPLDINELPLKTATKILINLAEPELAEKFSSRNVDGVGLLRAEFMIAQIGTHPKKLIHDRKQKVFINRLIEGMRTFCEQFEPRPVVYRATDFKTNEYQNLNGGKAFEPDEANPMLGYRGAYRYLNDPAVFELELQAVRKVRQDFKNLYLMIPFVHSPWELAKVKKIIAASGLLRSPTFKLWMMVEIPSNVILLEEFIKIGIDGVSVGLNDLTMLILGVDRDNSEVAQVFNERDPAVLWALEKVIKTCQKYKITSSICGQAPSVYPDLVEKLVEWGITSISINVDVIEETRRIVYEAERRMVTQKGLKNG